MVTCDDIFKFISTLISFSCIQLESNLLILSKLYYRSNMECSEYF